MAWLRGYKKCIFYNFLDFFANKLEFAKKITIFANKDLSFTNFVILGHQIKEDACILYLV